MPRTQAAKSPKTTAEYWTSGNGPACTVPTYLSRQAEYRNEIQRIQHNAPSLEGLIQAAVWAIRPDIKHNRIPAPEMSFTRPNLPVLIQEIESLLEEMKRGGRPGPS